MNDCINCEHCADTDEYEHEGHCKMWNKKVFVHIDGCKDFEWKEED